jgi:cbb3-type cytochrome oxidase cytochrome c subunit
MKNKILAVLMVLGFAGGLVATSATFAADATTKACKGKKAGDMVKVDGKEVKCPEAKKK